MHQEKALEELRSELDGAHGGAVVRLVGGTPTPATAGHGEARTRFAKARRCSRAQKRKEKGSEKGRSTEPCCSGENDRALASNSGRLEPYHVEWGRAQATRGWDEGVAKT